MARIRFPIETERLIIRPLTQDDAEDLHEVYADPEVMRFLTTDTPLTLDDTREWVQQKIDLFERDHGLSLWAVVERSSRRVIGDCGLQREDPEGGTAEIGLGGRGGRAFWHQGYGTEAGAACLRAGFEQLWLDRIIGMTRADNLAARRVMERLGMTHEGPCWDGEGVVYAVDRPAG